MTEEGIRSNLLCLVFTDLVDSTALKSRIGDVAASRLMANYHQEVLGLAGQYEGREIDSAGDGFFLTFEAPSAAVTFSLRLQLLHKERSDLPTVRIGVHLGEVTERPAPAGSSKPTLVEGLAVDLAARIGSLATGDQVLMSLPVFNAARQRLDEAQVGAPVSWLAHGPYLLKGIDEPVEIGEAGFEGISPLAPPQDSEKARSATAAGDELTLGWRPAVGLAIPGRTNWHLVEQLGTGAIGEVWLAHHEGTHAKRVFKFCFQADSLRSLKREVVLLRLLKESLGERPDIAQVIDWEFEHPPYFLETEHSEAGDLVAWAKSRGGVGKLSMETRIDLTAQIADALAAAHGAGVLHKDLKPSNVLINEGVRGEPRVCLADFGIGLVTSREALEVPGVTVAGLTEALLSSSIETGAGTRLYMAPEVMEGRMATGLADVYSLGVILYQLAAGDFNRALATGWERDVTDPLIREDIAACVDHDPDKRISGPEELAKRLRSHAERRAAQRSLATRARMRRMAIAAICAVILGIGTWWGYGMWAKVMWARDVAAPEIALLIEANDWGAAYDLAEQVEDALGPNPAMNPVWETISTQTSFLTDPPDAMVSYKPYEDVDGPWRVLGTTPIEDVRVPVQMMRWRVEKDGYVTREIAQKPMRNMEGTPFRRIPNLRLDPIGVPPEATVPIEAKTYAAVPLGSFPATGAFDLARAHIDLTEVTNAAYQEFVNAGGYENREYWKESFAEDGRMIPFDEAIERFTDSTGRPSPADWVLGEFPQGQENHPVSGVSWYEAAAYANFRERSLPTIYHWAVAALPDAEIVESLAPYLGELSNLESEGLKPVASNEDLSVIGAKDMAGNVSEWVWNASGDNRFLLGGSWADPAYRFTQTAATTPWRRRGTDGFRLVTYTEPPTAEQLAPVKLPTVDYHTAPAADYDEGMAILRSLSVYDKTPLNVVKERSIELALGGVAERVSLDPAFGDDRLILYVIKPENAEPPYQTVMWMGGMDILVRRNTEDWVQQAGRFLDFLRKSGRMVVLPIYSGTLERNNGRSLQRFNQGAVSMGEMINGWTKDVSRSIEYLEQNGEADMDRLAFVGLSLGAAVSPRFMAINPDFATLVLWSGGFAASSPPDLAPMNLMITESLELPVLMLNGRHDFVFPYQTHQRAYFERLGTAAEDKRHVLWDVGHFNFPVGEFFKENLDWLDKYLGPVAK
jgi:class 3 adenylate cyclase/predicted esterase